ncbi:allantoinase (plasmid) [Halostagnicola larsenii XH-48]|uniref:Allantoinase n=1 Tax=Halostagnicola larsenii XH-48 TaxID=797299 RepID=W0JVC5_9EURY|nr:amidohydrolase family protein [Halostagnicola larsenii]AHG01225.1 allantoinase [Halostagnicola larsenii XH-48]
MVDTLIRGGTVVTESDTFEADIGITGERIVTVGDETEMSEAETVVDATDKLVLPGVVDPHVHIDDMFSFDTYESASKAAALGGTTTFIDFAWEAWVGETSLWDEPGTILEGIERKRDKAEKPVVDFGLHGAITREDESVFEEIEAVIEAGVPTFKLFTAYEFGLRNGFMDRTFRELADHDAIAVLHSEDADLLDYLADRFQAEGKGDPEWYPRSRPDYAEAMAAEDAVRMAMEAGCRYYGIHTTCRKSAEVLAQYREAFGEEMVRAETCTHYTTLDDSIFEEMGLLPMIAPPIRKPADNDAMFEHLARGTLDVVSTDHCGYTKESKQVDNWWDSKFGANALQTSLPVFHDEAINERDYSYPFLVRTMCTNPARVFGLSEKGTLEPGTDADVLVFDPEATYTITAEDNASVADFSIYEGREVTGRVEKTFVRGELVADDGEIVGEPGHGRFVERDLPDWEF